MLIGELCNTDLREGGIKMTEDNLKKGKIAEKIVEKMFKESGFKVIQAGYEKTFSQLADRYNLLQGEASLSIRTSRCSFWKSSCCCSRIIEAKFVILQVKVRDIYKSFAVNVLNSVKTQKGANHYLVENMDCR